MRFHRLTISSTKVKNSNVPKWIWTNDYSDSVPYVQFDFDRTPYPGYLITSDQSLASSLGPAFLTATEHLRSSIDSLSVISNSKRYPLVSGSLHKRLLDEGADIEMHPTVIRCRDGETDRFYFARPMNFVDCIDQEKSQYEVNQYTKKIHDIRKLVLNGGCLGPRNIVRDRLAKFVLVSDVLMNDVCKIIGGSEPFVKPEDFKI